MRHSGFLSGLANPASDFVDDDIVVRSVTAQQAAQADDGVVFFCFRERASRGWDFEGAGDPDDLDAPGLCATLHESVECTLQQPIRNKCVEARNHDREACPSRIQLALQRLGSRFGSGFSGRFQVVIPTPPVILSEAKDLCISMAAAKSIGPSLRSEFVTFLCAVKSQC